MAQKTLTLGESRLCSTMSCGFCVPQILQLCLFIFPFIWNVASSKKINKLTKSSSFNCTIEQNWNRLSWGYNFWSNCSLYSLMCNFLHTTQHTVIVGISSSHAVVHIDFLGLFVNASLTRSMFLALMLGRPLFCFTHKHPVSTNFPCQL